MEITFALTPKDVAEAIRPVRPPARSRLAAGLVGVICGLGFAVAGFEGRFDSDDSVYTAPGPQNLWAALVPSLAVVLFVAIATRSRRIKKRNLSRNPLEPMYQSPMATALLSLPPLTLLVPLIPAFCIHWRPTPATQMFVGFAPWFGLGLFFVISLRFRTRVGKKAIESSPGLTRTRTVAITDAGFDSDDGVIGQRMQWAYFTRCRETANLLVLVTEDVRVTIIPKRAIADPADLIAIKAILQSHVPHCEFRHDVTGFLVTPLTADPIPVQAIDERSVDESAGGDDVRGSQTGRAR